MNVELDTIQSAAQALRSGRLTSVALTERCLSTIAAGNATLNAFITVTGQDALAQAVAMDRELASGRDRGPLHGIPLSLKDLFDVKGVPTTAASRVREGHVADADAAVVVRLREAGVVFVGKTNLHEFAFGTTNEESAFGPARHPLDPTRSPGGSSGGSAVSVATGMALASIGTDTGGSIRIPAAACGLVGLKPTSGEVPVDGVVPLSTSFDHVGPLCRNVADARVVYNALRGAQHTVERSPVPLARLRFRALRGYFLALVDDDVAASVESTLALLARAGVHVVDGTIDGTDMIGPIYLHVSLPEATAYHAATLDRVPERYTPGVRTRLEAGRYILAEDYVRAQRGRLVFRAAVDEALDGCDALVLPTCAIPAPPLGAVTMRVGDREEPVRNLMLRLTQPFNISGHPAVTLPCGSTRDGLPVGVQLVGHHGRTHALLDVASAVEALLDLGALTRHVLARFFHDWERRLADVSKDRVVRPFDWGTDWLPTSHANGAPRERVAAWVNQAMADSSSFFGLKTPTFHYVERAGHEESFGEAGALTFTSPLETPHPENNTVTARWFPSSDEVPIGAAHATRGRAVVVLSQWNADGGGHIGLSRLLAQCGVSALRLSLPYHDVRMPPELRRADYIVSSNVTRTVQVCRQAVLDARGAVAWLAAQGFTRIGILGTSLGSCLSLLTAAHEPRIRAQALNHVSPWFADVVWRGLSTRHVRQGLDGHIDLETLRDLWRPISPFSYLERVANTRTLLVYARYDLTFPVDLSEMLVAEFRRRGLPHTVATLPCGHYSSGMAPFKFLDAYFLINFLRRAL